jgi:hypothetical protein
VRDGMLALALTQPSFDSLRGNPRFEELLEEMGLARIESLDQPSRLVPSTAV